MVVVKAVKEFFGYTTIHGLGRCGDSKYIVQRIFWCVATFGCMALTAYQISRLHKQYTAGHLTTALDIKLDNLTFPVFRFCNLNPSPYSTVKNNTSLMAVLYATQQTLGVNLTDFDKPGETTVITDEVKEASASYEIGKLTEARDLFLRQLSAVRSEYNGLHPDQDHNPYAHRIEDIVLQCTFQGLDCDETTSLSRNIQDDELYGTCFEIRTENVPVLTAGPEQGLELMINLDHEEFIPFIPEGIGINTRLYDDQNKNPFLAESSDGVRLSAGFEINIAISLTEYNRKPGNNARCDYTNKFPNILACLEQCVRDVVSEKCGCGATEVSEYSFEPCDNSASLVCKKRIQQSIYSHCPACKQPCNENVMLVRVYYSSLTVQSFNEEVSYTEENFVSDIGGQLGLLIGMSVLTLAEVVELCILILIGFCEPRNKDVTPVVPITKNKGGTDTFDTA